MLKVKSPDIIFINGLYQNKESWISVYDKLDSELKILTFDLPNQTAELFDRSAECFINYIDYIKNYFIQNNIDTSNATVIGLSSGANMIRYLHCIENIEFQRIILLSPNPGGIEIFYKQYTNSLLNVLEAGGIELFAHSSIYTSFSPIFFQKSSFISQFLVDQIKLTYQSEENCLKALIKAVVSDPSLQSPPTNFRCETHIVTASEDPLIPSSKFENYLNSCTGNITHKEVSGGHSFPLEDSTSIASYINSQLSSTISDVVE